MKQLLVLIGILVSACNISQNINDPTGSENISSEMQTYYLRIDRQRFDFPDIVIPVDNKYRDFDKLKGSLGLRSFDNVRLYLSNHQDNWTLPEDLRKLEFDQNKYIYSSGDLVEFITMEQLEKKNDLIIQKIQIPIEKNGGDSIGYTLKAQGKYMYIGYSPLSDPQKAEEVIYGIELAENVDPDLIIESQLKW